MTLRRVQRWCNPKSVLLASEMCGEPGNLLPVVRDIKERGTRVFFTRLCPVGERERSGLPALGPSYAQLGLPGAQDELGRALQWAELLSECTILKNSFPSELPELVETLPVDQVMISGSFSLFRWNPVSGSTGLRILQSVRVPVMMLGNRTAPSPVCGRKIRRVLAPISFTGDLRPQLRLACLLARQHGARLTVLHVFAPEDSGSSNQLRTPVAVGARLPLVELAREGFLYPLQVSIAQGSPEGAILDALDKDAHELLIMGGPGRVESAWAYRRAVAPAVIAEARCPVLIAGRALAGESRQSDQLAGMRVTAVPPRSSIPNKEAKDAVC